MTLFTKSFTGLMAIIAVGCAERGEPPSLAKRPFETASAPAPAEAIKPSASDPARVARIADILERGRRGQLAFADAATVAEKAIVIARGAPISSEPWIAAQLALSRLITLRGPVQTALADIDDERRLMINGGLSADEQRLTSALEDIELLSNAQAETIARLSAMLRSN